MHTGRVLLYISWEEMNRAVTVCLKSKQIQLSKLKLDVMMMMMIFITFLFLWILLQLKHLFSFHHYPCPHPYLHCFHSGLYLLPKIRFHFRKILQTKEFPKPFLNYKYNIQCNEMSNIISNTTRKLESFLFTLQTSIL